MILNETLMVDAKKLNSEKLHCANRIYTDEAKWAQTSVPSAYKLYLEVSHARIELA